MAQIARRWSLEVAGAPQRPYRSPVTERQSEDVAEHVGLVEGI